MFLVHACCRLTPPARRRGQPNVLASLSMPFVLTPLLPLFFLAHVAVVAGMCLTTLARLPFRLGLGRVWTPSFIFRTLSPICTLVRTRILFRFPLLFGYLYCIYLYLGSLESLLYIYVLLGSIVNYCDVTICDQFHPHCVHV